MAIYFRENCLLIVLLILAVLVITVGRKYGIAPIAAWYDHGIAEGELKVADRFLEMPGGYDVSKFRLWVTQHSAAAKGYAFPVLFPLDLIFMVVFAGLLGVTSAIAANYLATKLGSHLGFGPHFAWGVAAVALILPAVYLAVDLAEDSLLVLMLTGRQAVSDEFAGFVSVVTRIKIATVTWAIWQTACLFLVAALWFLVSADWKN
jgi:uncharacterized membrane protein (DUF485 family)